MYAHLIQPAQRSKHLRADPCRFKRAHYSACAGKILPCAGSCSGQARPIPLCHGILVRHGRTWRHVHGRSAALSQHPRIGRDLPFTFWQFAHIINHIGKGGTCRLRLSKTTEDIGRAAALPTSNRAQRHVRWALRIFLRREIPFSRAKISSLQFPRPGIREYFSDNREWMPAAGDILPRLPACQRDFFDRPSAFNTKRCTAQHIIYGGKHEKHAP